MIPIHFKILDAAHCRVLKNPDHWNIIWDILSYNVTYRRGPRIIHDKGSHFDKRSGRGYFGLGLYKHVTSELDKLGVEYNLEILCETSILDVKPMIFYKHLTPEDYQAKAVKILDTGIKRGIFQAPTGAGKTLIETAIIKKLGIPNTLIITPNKSICNQTIDSLKNFLNRDIGLLGQGQRDWKRVSVSLYQTLSHLNIEELDKFIDLIIVDECHLAPDAISAILEQFKTTWYRFGLSGTVISKNDRKNWFTATGQLGEIISKTTEKEADKRVINDVDAFMFYFFDVASIEKNYFKVYRNDVLRNTKRCELLLEMVQFGFEMAKVKNCLLLVDEYEQALLIQQLAILNYKNKRMHPKIAWKDSDNEEIKKAIIDNKIPFCVATPVFSVGTDIPNIEHICLGSARKKQSNTKQKIGRGRRKIEGVSETLLVTDVFDDIENHAQFKEYSISRRGFYKLKKWYRGLYVKNFKGEWVETKEI